MTQRDYELVAGVVRRTLKEVGGNMVPVVVGLFVEKFCEEAKKQTKRFSEDKFREACRVTTE